MTIIINYAEFSGYLLSLAALESGLFCSLSSKCHTCTVVLVHVMVACFVIGELLLVSRKGVHVSSIIRKVF